MQQKCEGPAHPARGGRASQNKPQAPSLSSGPRSEGEGSAEILRDTRPPSPPALDDAIQRLLKTILVNVGQGSLHVTPRRHVSCSPGKGARFSIAISASPKAITNARITAATRNLIEKICKINKFPHRAIRLPARQVEGGQGRERGRCWTTACSRTAAALRDGSMHTHTACPTLLAGKGGGSLKDRSAPALS